MAPPLRVGSETHGISIKSPEKKTTGPDLITQEEEYTDTGPPPKLYPTRNWTSPPKFKVLAVNAQIYY